MYVGDFKKAKELCDELNSLSTLRFDPTNPELRGEWDVSRMDCRRERMDVVDDDGDVVVDADVVDDDDDGDEDSGKMKSHVS